MFDIILFSYSALLMVCALAVFYMLPYMVSVKRKSPNQLAIFMFNLLLGWTFIGWAFAMVWACLNKKVG